MTEEHEHGREESGRYVRLACSCGHRGPWRPRVAITLPRLLASDDSQHIFAVRRAGA